MRAQGSWNTSACLPSDDDEWRRWIAENLMLGASRESILKSMVDGGLAPSESATEIDLAFKSPYLKGAERLCNRLKKREWLLAAYRKLNRLRPSSGEIERGTGSSRANSSIATTAPIARSSSRA